MGGSSKSEHKHCLLLVNLLQPTGYVMHQQVSP